MDFTHRKPTEFRPKPPPPPAIHHNYNPYRPPLLPHPPPSYYPNPSPKPTPDSPRPRCAVGPADGSGANADAGKGLAAYYYARIAADPVSHGQIPPSPSGGSNLATPSHAGSNPAKVVESAYCGLCNIECTTEEVLNVHKQGKKHRRKELITPQVTTNPEENQEQKRTKGSPEEELEAKKRRFLEGGVQPNELKVCTICNIVANSQKVFDSHIFGSKHAGKVRKQQEVPCSELRPKKKKKKGKRNKKL